MILAMIAIHGMLFLAAGWFLGPVASAVWIATLVVLIVIESRKA